MKNIIKVSILFAILFLVMNAISRGQGDDKFQIQSPFKKSTFNGKELRSMSNKELKSILSSDPLALAKFKNGNAVSGAGSALLCIGSFLVLYNSLLQNDGINDGSLNSDQTLSTIGLTIIASSIPFYIAGGNIRKSAIRNFRASSKKEISMRFTPIIFSTENFVGGISFSARF